LTDKCVDVNMRVRLSEVTSFQQWNASTQHRHLSCRSWLNFFSFPVRMTRDRIFCAKSFLQRDGSDLITLIKEVNALISKNESKQRNRVRPWSILLRQNER